MKRGEVWWVDFEPAVGSEIQKKRPAIIVSNDAFNRHATRLQVVPLTTNVARLYPSEAYVTLRGQKRKAMTDQLQTASKLRFGALIGRLSHSDMQEVERAMRIQLGLDR